MLRGDEGLDVGEAGVGVVEPHDLEHAPAGRLQRCCAVEQAGRLQPFPLAGQRAGVLLAVPARITQPGVRLVERLEEHTSELQSLMRISYAVFSLQKNKYVHTEDTSHELPYI